MSRKNIIIAGCVIFCLALVVWFVVPNNEEQAKSQLDAAYKVELSGELDRAITLYEALIREYSGTSAADLASEYLVRVTKYTERALIEKADADFDRIFLVLKGYRDMLGKNLTSIQTLDDGSYMFDSDYIAEIVPEGHTYFLRIDIGGQSSTLYSRKKDLNKIVRREETGAGFILPLDVFEKEINLDGYSKIEKGRMVFLQPTSG